VRDQWRSWRVRRIPPGRARGRAPAEAQLNLVCGYREARPFAETACPPRPWTSLPARLVESSQGARRRIVGKKAPLVGVDHRGYRVDRHGDLSVSLLLPRSEPLCRRRDPRNVRSSPRLRGSHPGGKRAWRTPNTGHRHESPWFRHVGRHRRAGQMARPAARERRAPTRGARLPAHGA